MLFRSRLRMPVPSTRSLRVLRRALHELRASIIRFNERWNAFLPTVDLSELNAQREAYNRYYLLEKECALRSARLARQGFRRLEPLSAPQFDRVSFRFDPAQNRTVHALLEDTGRCEKDQQNENSGVGFGVTIEAKTGLVRGTYQPPLPGGGNSFEQKFTGAILRSENTAIGASLSQADQGADANVTWQMVQLP